MSFPEKKRKSGKEGRKACDEFLPFPEVPHSLRSYAWLLYFLPMKLRFIFIRDFIWLLVKGTYLL